MKIDVIVGGLYEKEGKGKLVNSFGPKCDYISRVNDSMNVGHTVQLDSKDLFIAKQLSSVFDEKGKALKLPISYIGIGRETRNLIKKEESFNA